MTGSVPDGRRSSVDDPTAPATAAHPVDGPVVAPVDADVVVIGDGPAGSALAAALVARGVDTVLVGDDEAWNATYGTWADDLEALTWFDTDGIWSERMESIAVDVGGRRTLARPYGVVDNAVLRRRLRHGVRHRVLRVEQVDVDRDGGAPGHGRATTEILGRGPVDAADERDGTASPPDPTDERGGEIVRLRARLVVDATGFPGRFSRRAGRAAGTPDGGGSGSVVDPLGTDDVARQSAFGVVLERPPDGHLGSPVLMDFSDPGVGDDGLGPTFAYALPVGAGWLVEETVLAARPRVDPDRLLPRLAARLATTPDRLLERAVEVERVDIPMGGPLPDLSSPVVAFGAAASMIHPATGYSITSSLSSAERVAAAVADHLDDPLDVAVRHVWEAVWPTSARRTRVLHDYGLGILVDLDADTTRRFFATFFELDRDDWARYLRIDTPPTRLAAVMATMFRRAPWALRARLVSGDPRAFAALLRP